jgi:mRNA-degrading endonuclease RelE of RelBE toxin-antitoxin system
MPYELEFHEKALDELNDLDGSIRSILRKQLNARLLNSRIASARLKGDLGNFYKLKVATCGNKGHLFRSRRGAFSESLVDREKR